MDDLTQRQKFSLALIALAVAFAYFVVVPIVTREDGPSKADVESVRALATQNQKALNALLARSTSRTQTFDEIQTSLQVVLRQQLVTNALLRRMVAP